jgi:hypothetical protein
LLNQVHGKGLTQQVRFLTGRPQSRARHGQANALREPGTAQGPLASEGAKERATRVVRASPSQIVCQRLTRFGRERQLALAPVLGGRHAQFCVAPIHTVQAQSSHLCGPQSQASQTKHQRAVALAHQRQAIKDCHQLSELRPTQVNLQVFPVMAGDGRQRRTQILGVAARQVEKSSKRPQRQGQGLQLPRGIALALLQHKLQQALRGELRKVQLGGLRLELRF